MSIQVASGINLIRNSLNQNYPNAVIKSGESGECDYRISSVGASISVRSYNEYHITESDVDQILKESKEILDERVLKFRDDMSSNDTKWFELHKSK